MARPPDSDRASQLKEFMETYKAEHGGRWPSDYAIGKQFGWGAGVITRIRRLIAEAGMIDAVASPEPQREDLQKNEILNQLNQVLRPVVDTLHEHTLGREQRTRDRLEDRLRDRGQTLERLSRDLSEATRTIHRQKADIADGEQQAEKLRQTIRDHNTVISGLNHDVNHLKERIDELTEARNTLQANETELLRQLETLHKSHVEQRELDRQRSETEKERIRLNLTQAKEELSSLRNENVKLSTTLKDEYNRFLLEREDKQSALDDARIARETAEKYQASAATLQSKLEELELELRNQTGVLEKQETRLAVQDESLARQRELMDAKNELNEQLKLALALTNQKHIERPNDPNAHENDH